MATQAKPGGHHFVFLNDSINKNPVFIYAVVKRNFSFYN